MNFRQKFAPAPPCGETARARVQIMIDFFAKKR